MNIRKFILEKSSTQKSNTQKRSKKSPIFIALMFLALMSPKAWGYAQKELPPSFSEESFSSGEIFSSDQTFFLSRAVLTDEKGVAICQVNLQENPEFLPQFAEAGSTDLKPLDLPECEEQSLDIVAQYADQAWVKRDVAFFPVAAAAGLAFAGGCSFGFFAGWLEYGDMENMDIAAIWAGLYGGAISVPLAATSSSSSFASLVVPTVMVGAGVGVLGGLVCYGITNGIRMIYE